jgi:hypothetical protein
MRKSFFYIVTCLVLLAGVPVEASIYENIGSYENWATEWTSISGVNDQDNQLDKAYLDFVGDSSDSGGYWARNNDFLFFRARVNQGTLASNTFSDSVFFAINVVGENMDPATKHLVSGPDDGKADYSLSWDSNQLEKNHGFEMSIRSSQNGPNWDDFQFDDIDGSSGQKGSDDINGDISDRGYDGYIRTIDSQSTTNFGSTSFIDLAISFDYLTNYTDLDFDSQTWKMTFGSATNATDHNPVSYDVAGGVSPTDSATSGFSVPIPEPTTMGLLAIGGAIILLKRRKN